MMRFRKIFCVFILLMSFMLVGCDKPGNETKKLEIIVYDKSEKEIFNEIINTSDNKLLPVLESFEELNIKSIDGNYGRYITSIKEIEEDGEYFWSYYVNGSYGTVGIDSYKIQDNDKVEFRIEKVMEME